MNKLIIAIMFSIGGGCATPSLKTKMSKTDMLRNKMARADAEAQHSLAVKAHNKLFHECDQTAMEAGIPGMVGVAEVRNEVCSIHLRECNTADIFTRPDLCGSTYMVKEWAKVDVRDSNGQVHHGVNSPAYKQCNAIAARRNTTIFHYTGLLSCDGKSPVNHCMCVPTAIQIASLPSM
jgi:hypothetical protein